MVRILIPVIIRHAISCILQSREHVIFNDNMVIRCAISCALQSSIPATEQTFIERMTLPSLDRRFTRPISQSPIHVVTKANKFVHDKRTIIQFLSCFLQLLNSFIKNIHCCIMITNMMLTTIRTSPFSIL